MVAHSTPIDALPNKKSMNIGRMNRIGSNLLGCSSTHWLLGWLVGWLIDVDIDIDDVELYDSWDLLVKSTSTHRLALPTASYSASTLAAARCSGRGSCGGQKHTLPVALRTTTPETLHTPRDDESA